MKNAETILEERARELAKKAPSDFSDRKRLEVVLFNLAHETYAIELRYIKEVYPLRDPTPVPHTPGFVVGIINYRGQILSVVDLRKFFDLPDNGVSDENRVVVLESEDMAFGILAEAVREVAFLAVEDIQAVLPTLTDVRARYLKGVNRDGVVVLDGRKLLGDEKMTVK